MPKERELRVHTATGEVLVLVFAPGSWAAPVRAYKIPKHGEAALASVPVEPVIEKPISISVGTAR